MSADAQATTAQAFGAWVLRQRMGDSRVRAVDDTHLLVESDVARGEINFYDMPDGSEIAEMRIARKADDEQVFFLHFELGDQARARELFGEMAEAFVELGERREVHVLLCCTCGITTTMFATKMNEVSRTLQLEYRFEAKPLDAALAAGASYDAVMLAPQVAHLRAKVAEAFPQAAVFEVPGKLYGSYDAAGGVRLVSHVLGHESSKSAGAPEGETARLPAEGDLAWDGRVMVVSAVLGSRTNTFEYRVYERGDVLLDGKTAKRVFDFRDIEDLLASVRLRGFDVGTLDAIAIAVPGIIDEGTVSLLSHDVHDYDLGRHVEDAYGIPVFLDNDANAAAAGCFATQARFRSITFHREDFGHAGCGQGSIVEGRLVTGRHNFAGELNHLVAALRFSADPNDLAWTEDGLREVVSRFLLCNICTYAPEAIYVDAWPVTDMDALRAELLPFLDDKYIPELIPAPDFNECVLTGELALCVQRLRRR